MFLLLLVLTTATQEIQFWGHHFLSLEKERKVIITDSAGVREGTTILLADSIVFFQDSGILKAYKSPVLILDSDTLFGDSFLYRTEIGKGVAFRGVTRVEKGCLRGRDLYQVSKEVLQLEEGTFTTCEENPPHYFFQARRMVVRKNDMAVVSPLVLRVHKIPVFAAPFWFFPVSRGRKSGFMTPRFGFNSLDGRSLRNLSYYWAINNYMDLTVTLDLIEKRGARVGLDFIYTLYKHFQGSAAMTFAQEFSPEKRRWSLFGSHLHTLGRGFSIRAQSNLASDVDYLKDYSEDKTEWLKTEWTSFLSLTKRWDFASLSMNLDERRDLVRNTRKTLIPSLRWGLYTLSAGPIRFSHTLDFIRRKEWGDSLETSLVANSSLYLTSQLKVFGVLQVSPELKEVTTFFDRDTSGRHMVRRDIASAQVSLSTVIYGMSLFGVGPFERFRQTLRPSLSFKITPNVEQGHIVPVSGYGPIPPSRSYTFSLSNIYEGKTEDGKKVTILTSELSTGRDLLNPQSKPPVSFSFQLFPQEKINWRASGSYDVTEKRVQYLSVITNLNFSIGGPGDASDTLEEKGSLGPWKFRITHSFSRGQEGEATQRLSSSVQGNLTKNWRFSYSMDLDPKSGEMLTQSLSLDRDLHCWSLSFRWWIQPGGVWSYNFKIWIKSLPDISFKRSLFEIFLPK